MKKPVITVKALTKWYGRPGQGVLAVDHVNFEVYEGEIFGFLGPNGAGKSTTQRMLTTLLEPTEGRITVHGRDLAHHTYTVKRQLGLVPEEANIYTELTAWQNLIFAAHLYLIPRQERVARAEELLHLFGLWPWRHVKADNFSKGMRRRLSIAMGIIHRPTLLFLDEPTAGLDAHSVHTIRALVRQMNAAGTTIFLTTHQIEEANRLCDRVAIIDHGQIAAIDTPERLKETFRQVQSVEVAWEPDEEDDAVALEQMPHVTEVVKVGDKWRLYTREPSALLPLIVHHAERRRARIISLTTLRPTLEDVFLQITGRPLGVTGDGGQDHRTGEKNPGQTLP
jgi:ABC-2 type transport system ATP-binding protein